MPIAVTEDHEALRMAVQRWAQTHCLAGVPRSVAESEPSADVPEVWEKMAAQGWLGLHLRDEDGGEGFTLGELAVVLEELGYALFPGPLLPTLVVSAALARHAGAGVDGSVLPGLADGSVTAAVALDAAPFACEPAAGRNGAVRITRDGASGPRAGLGAGCASPRPGWGRRHRRRQRPVVPDRS